MLGWRAVKSIAPDSPSRFAHAVTYRAYSPPTRGCSVRHQVGGLRVEVLPADAGVLRDVDVGHADACCPPHRRGGALQVPNATVLARAARPARSTQRPGEAPAPVQAAPARPAGVVGGGFSSPSATPADTTAAPARRSRCTPSAPTAAASRRHAERSRIRRRDGRGTPHGLRIRRMLCRQASQARGRFSAAHRAADGAAAPQPPVPERRGRARGRVCGRGGGLCSCAWWHAMVGQVIGVRPVTCPTACQLTT
ncbi:pyruvate/2-oxoglutarate dehydrogenase complex dihydrolipoamide acyltransferase (E2) component [Streptomyces phaeoluteigriseus]